MLHTLIQAYSLDIAYDRYENCHLVEIVLVDVVQDQIPDKATLVKSLDPIDFSTIQQQYCRGCNSAVCNLLA